MPSDGAVVNNAVYNQLAVEFGDHYLGILCPSHKFELTINYVFGLSILNNITEKDYSDIYYLFKKLPLQWHLLKRQSLFMGILYKRFKRLTSTRWVEHQVMVLNSHLGSLLILISFCDQQIKSPHTATIKKLVPTFFFLSK